MQKPERVPGGWKVGDEVFRGRLAREKAFKAAAEMPEPKPKKKAKKKAKKKKDSDG